MKPFGIAGQLVLLVLAVRAHVPAVPAFMPLSLVVVV